MVGVIVVILVILAIIILIVIFRSVCIYVYYTPKVLFPVKLGEHCNMTSECSIGLTCDQSFCSIPIDGSCVNKEDMCADGGVCFKGMCTPNNNIDMLPISSHTFKEELINKKDDVVIIKTSVEPDLKIDRENNFRKLTFSDGKEVSNGEYIIDASYSSTNNMGYMWYIAAGENSYYITVKDYNGSMATREIPDKKTPISCQAFGKICYILIKGSAGEFDIQKFTYKDNSPKVTKDIIGSLDVEFPHFPKHSHVERCINLGVSSMGVIMIVTSESNISFNPDSIDEDVSTWFINNMDNRDILYMNHVKDGIFSLTQDQWFYKDTFGEREENTYPVVTNNGTVENKHYWAKDGLFLFDKPS